MNKKIWKKAVIKSIPILFSYLFVGAAYGMMMQQCFYVDLLYGGKKWTIVKKVFYTFSVQRFSLR